MSGEASSGVGAARWQPPPCAQVEGRGGHRRAPRELARSAPAVTEPPVSPLGIRIPSASCLVALGAAGAGGLAVRPRPRPPMEQLGNLHVERKCPVLCPTRTVLTECTAV